MRPAKSVPVEMLREIFALDPLTGILRWRVRLNAYTVVGERAGGVCDKGYFRVQFLNCKARVHVVCWAMHFGEWPKQSIDHINGDRKDNRISNLRLASMALNAMNRRVAHSQNGTGLLGAHRHGTKFTSAICTNGKQRHLGVFDTPEDAHAAYIEAKHLYHSEVFV